jgi:rod shape-determining protein MreD
VSAAAALRASAVIFAAALLQTAIVSSIVLFGGAPDLLLVVVVSLGLLRGSVAGAVFGFAGGLVVDVLTLDTLGVTSLVLTLAGFWAGRYGETTGRGRRVAPFIAVAVITVLATLFGFTLHYLLGEAVDARRALVAALVPTLVANLALTYPVHALVRAVVGEREAPEPSPEVEVVV